jgi:hypothetical protein
MDLEKIKRARLTQLRGQETVNQVEHIDSAGAKLVMGGVLVAGDVMTADPSAAPVKVLAGSILRIQVSADTYVAFGDDPTASPLSGAISSSTSPAIKLPAGYHLVVATGDFVRMSAAPTRCEIIAI